MASKIVRSLLGLVMALTGLAASAAPLVYDESVSGDIDGSPTFALDTGTNTVRGDMSLVLHWSTLGQPVFTSVDFDAFQFSLPPGTTLTSATIKPVFSDTTGRTTEASLATFLIYAGGTLSEDHCFHLFGKNDNLCESLVGGEGNLATVSLPRSEPLLGLGYSFFLDTLDQSQDYGGTIAYEVSLVVQSVSEPAALLLAPLGLLALFGQRNRRERDDRLLPQQL